MTDFIVTRVGAGHDSRLTWLELKYMVHCENHVTLTMVATVVTNLTFHINLDTQDKYQKSRSWVIAKTKHVDDTVRQ